MSHIKHLNRNYYSPFMFWKSFLFECAMIRGSANELQVKCFVTYIILAAVLFIEARFWNDILCVAAHASLETTCWSTIYKLNNLKDIYNVDLYIIDH